MFVALLERKIGEKLELLLFNCSLFGRKNKDEKNPITNLRQKWAIFFPHISCLHVGKKFKMIEENTN